MEGAPLQPNACACTSNLHTTPHTHHPNTNEAKPTVAGSNPAGSAFAAGDDDDDGEGVCVWVVCAGGGCRGGVAAAGGGAVTARRRGPK